MATGSQGTTSGRHCSSNSARGCGLEFEPKRHLVRGSLQCERAAYAGRAASRRRRAARAMHVSKTETTGRV